MPLRYCSLHERVFDQHHRRWMAFPRDKMAPLTHVFALYRALGLDCAYQEVIETSCDQCDALATQILHKLLDAPERLP